MHKPHRIPWAVLCVLAGLLPATPRELPAEEVVRPTPPVVREILVPFEDLDVVLQNQARRVFVNREEYDRLVREAKQSPDRRPPQSTAIVSTAYEATVAEGRARIEGTIVVDVLADGLHMVSLDIADVGIQQALLDGKPAVLGRQGSQQPLLFVRGRGRHTLRLSVVAPIATSAAQQTLAFVLPQAGATQMKLAVPGNIELKSGADVVRRTVDEDAGLTRFELLLSRGATSLSMSLNNRMLREGRVVLANSVHVAELTEAYERLHVTASMDVLHGATDSFRFRVPAGFEITGVTAEDLLRWEVSEVDQQPVLEVVLREPATKTVVLNIAAMKSESTPAAWTMPRLVPLDVAGDTTVVGMLAEQRYRLQSIETSGLIPIDTQVLTNALPQSIYESEPGAPQVQAVAAFYAPQQDFALSAVYEKPPARVRVSTNLLLVLSDTRQRVRGGFSLVAEAEEIFECDFHVPAGWEILSVTYEDSSPLKYETYAADGGQRVHVRLPQGVPPGQAYSIFFEAVRVPDDWLAAWQQRTVEFPQFYVLDASGDIGALAVQALDDLSARPQQLTGLTPLDDNKKAEYGLAGVATDLVFRYDQGRPRLTLQVERTQPRVTARTFSFLTLNRDNVAAHYELIYDVTEARTRTLSLVLPGDTPEEISLRGLDGVQVKEFRSRVSEGRRIWTAELAEPRRGAVRLAVDFTSRRDTQLGEEFALPIVRATDVAYQSGVVAVEGSAELEVQLKQHPRRVDVGELVDADYQPGRRLLGVFGFTGSQPRVTALASSYPGYALPAAIVQRSELTTVVSASGVSQTAARFLLRTKSLFVEVVLPEGSELWSAQLDGVPAKPQREGKRLLLSLPSDDAGLRDLQLVYETPIRSLNLWGRIQVPAPQLLLHEVAGGQGRPLPMADLKWQLLLPTGYELVDSEGTVFRTAEPGRPLPIVRVAGALLFSPGLQLAREMAAPAAGGLAYYGDEGAEAPQTTSEMPTADYAAQLPADAGAVDAEEFLLEAPNAAAPAETKPGEPVVRPADEPANAPAADPFGPPATYDSPPKPAPPENVPPQRGASTETATGGQAAETTRQSGKMRKLSWALEGLSSLKIDIQSDSYAGGAIDFASLGVDPTLDVTVVDRRRVQLFSWGLVLFILLIGGLLVRRGARAQIKYVAAIVVVTTVLPLLTGWSGQLATLLDMACFAAVLLIPFYLLAALVRWGIDTASQRWTARAAQTAALVLVVAGIAAAPALAEDPPGAEQPPFVIRVEPTQPAVAIPEDAIVIPYDPDKELAPQRNARLLVPYQRYVDLWNRANPNQADQKQVLPAEFGLAGAQFRTRLDGDDYLVVEGHIDVEVFADGVVTVPLQLGGGVLAAADIGGKPARLQVMQIEPPTVAAAVPQAANAAPQMAQPQQMRQTDIGRQGPVPAPAGSLVALYVAGPGAQRLNLAVRFPLERRGGWRVAQGRLPSAPATELTLVAPQAGTEVRLAERLDRNTYATTEANEKITTALRLDGSFRIGWRPKIAEAMVDRSLTVTSLALFDVQEDSLSMAWQMDLEFRRGQRDAFSIEVPDDYLVEKVEGPNVRGWQLDAERNQLEVKLLASVRDRDQFVIYLSRRGAVGEGPLATFEVPVLRVPDAVLHRGQIGIRRSPMIELRTLADSGLARTDQMAATAQLEKLSISESPLGIRAYQAYRFATMPFTLRLAAAPLASQTSAVVNSVVRVAERQRQLESQIHIHVQGRPVYQIRVAIPDDLDIRNVSADTWSVTQEEGRRVLNVFLAEGFDARHRLVLSGQLGKTGPVETIALPRLEVLGVERQEGSIVVQADPALEVRAVELENCQTTLLERTYSWLAAGQRAVARLAIQYDAPDYSGRLQMQARQPRVACTAVTNVRVTEKRLEETIYLAYEITDAGVRRVVFQLPKSLREARISAPLLRQKTVTPVEGDADRVQVELELQDEVMGEFRVLIEHDRLPADGDYSVPLPVVDGARTTRQFVVVESAGRDEVVFDTTSGLLPLSRQQSQWKMLAGLLPGGITQAFFVEGDPRQAQLVLHTEGRAAVETAGARIELAETVLILDAHGAYRAVQVYHMDNSTEQALGVILPEGATLWTAQVAGAAVKPTRAPQAAASEVRIPLVKTAEGDANFPVVLKYGGQIAPLGSMRQVDFPLLRTTNVNVELSQVRLWLPEDYQWFDFDGSMRLVEDEGDLLAGVVAYYNKQIKKFTEIHSGSNPFASVRAKSNLKQLELRLDDLQSENNRYSGNEKLQKELQANTEAWSKAQEQLDEVQPQEEAETDNRRQLNDLFESQSFGRAKNIVSDLDSNFGTADISGDRSESGEKSGRFNKDWISRNKLGNSVQPGKQPQSRVITKPGYPSSGGKGTDSRPGKAPQIQQPSQPAVPQQQPVDPQGESAPRDSNAAERSRGRESERAQIKRYAEQVEMQQQQLHAQQDSGGFYRQSRNDDGPPGTDGSALAGEQLGNLPRTGYVAEGTLGTGQVLLDDSRSMPGQGAQSATMAHHLASLDVEFPRRGVEYLLTTPRGELSVTARAVAQPVIGRAKQAAWTLGGLLLLGAVFTAVRRRAAGSHFGRGMATLLIVGGVLLLLLGLIWPIALAAVILGIVQHVRLSLAGRFQTA